MHRRTIAEATVPHVQTTWEPTGIVSSGTADKLVVQYWFQNEKDALGDEVREKIEEGLNPVEIEMSAELGCTHLTIDDFLNLSRGDIIRLDNKCTNPIKIYVEDQECYYATPKFLPVIPGLA